MANPIGRTAHNPSHQEMNFADEENGKNSNLLGIQNLGNNFEEIRTGKRGSKRKKKVKQAEFIVTDVDAK